MIKDINFPDFIFLPLEVNKKPPYDKSKLVNWLNENYKRLLHLKSKLATAESYLSDEQYPWDLTTVYQMDLNDKGPGYINGFDKEFPELCRWFLSNYNLNIDDVSLIVFLQLRPTYTGWGFWHTDADPFGLRIMLDCDIEQEKLYARRFKKYYSSRPILDVPIPDHFMEEEITECKILHPCQSHLITNRLAGHATYTMVPNTGRLCVLIANKPTLKARMGFTNSLLPIVNQSIESFKNNGALLW